MPRGQTDEATQRWIDGFSSKCAQMQAFFLRFILSTRFTRHRVAKSEDNSIGGFQLKCKFCLNQPMLKPSQAVVTCAKQLLSTTQPDETLCLVLIDWICGILLQRAMQIARHQPLRSASLEIITEKPQVAYQGFPGLK